MNEKKKLIDEINKIRKEIGLSAYPFDHLERKHVEELKKLYESYLKLSESYKKKFKLDLKIGLLFAISIVIAVSFFFYQFTLRQEKEIELFPPSKLINFSVDVAYSDNQTLFLLQNHGTNISSFKVGYKTRRFLY
jgi:hypothetical protein